MVQRRIEVDGEVYTKRQLMRLDVNTASLGQCQAIFQLLSERVQRANERLDSSSGSRRTAALLACRILSNRMQNVTHRIRHLEGLPPLDVEAFDTRTLTETLRRERAREREPVPEPPPGMVPDFGSAMDDALLNYMHHQTALMVKRGNPERFTDEQRMLYYHQDYTTMIPAVKDMYDSLDKVDFCDAPVAGLVIKRRISRDVVQLLLKHTLFFRLNQCFSFWDDRGLVALRALVSFLEYHV